MDILLQDVRYAARKLLRTPGFSIIAIATLALAIGATTAVFSIVNGVLLKPLPFPNPHEIVRVGSATREGRYSSLSGPDFIDYRDQTRSFVAMAAVQERNSANLSVAGSEPLRLNSAGVGAKFFDIFGAPMQLGRGFLDGDDKVGAPRVVVVSDNLWRTKFSGDPRVIGRSISLNGDAHTIVGVAPATLTYPSTPDVWTPLVLEPWMIDPENRGSHFMQAVARVKPTVAVDAANREMATLGARLAKEYPQSNTNFGGMAQSLHESLVGDVRMLLYTMFGAVAFVLLIACANVANLLLVRAASRETEMAVRTALGAGRARIVRQLITESLLLSAAGAMIGGALAAWAVDAIVAFGPRGLPRIDSISVDPRVLGFSALVALITGVVFGLVPAIHAAKDNLGQMLKESVRGSSAKRATQRTRAALVVSEMALAVVLLVGAGLLIRSFVKLIRVDPGFQTEHIVTFEVSLPLSKYPVDRDARGFGAQIRERLASLPGTQSVALAFARPLQPFGVRTSFEIVGQPNAPLDKRRRTDVRPASSNFFATMGIRLVRGRLPTPAEENFGPPPVVVVTQSLAKAYFPNEDPIGKHIILGASHDTAGTNSSVTAGGEIIGIVNDVRQRRLNEDAAPAVYLGWGTFPMSDVSIIVRSTRALEAIGPAIRERVRAIDPQMPIFDLRTMEDAVSDSVSQPRFYMTLLSAFAGLALLLAALGIYGVISYSVSQRTRELGIRIALGATQDRVVRLVLGQGVLLTVFGVALGLAGAFWLVKLLDSLLFGVGATDPPTFVAVGAVLLGVASLASYVPARRAARVDPVIAMRAD
jgi:putative ABC transport system permease protein